MTSKSISGDLVKCFVGVILFARKICVSTELELDDVVRKIDKKLRDSVKAAMSKGVDVRDYDNARFAVCAWIDELLMTSKWRYQNTWKDHLLQEKYYGTTGAGTEYFIRLANLKLNQCSVREIFIFCLTLGFRGKYSKAQIADELETLKEAELKKLGLGKLLKTRANIMPEAYPRNLKRRMAWPGEAFTRSAGQRTVIHWLFALGLLLGSYLVFDAILDARLPLSASVGTVS